MRQKDLIGIAKEAQSKAFAPYSHFRVGAALVSKSGKIYTGCNIENSSYSLTCCAERVAIFKAISEGETQFKSITIVGDAPEYTPPCGACRQVMFELGGPKLTVNLVHANGKVKTMTSEELLPGAFDSSHLS